MRSWALWYHMSLRSLKLLGNWESFSLLYRFPGLWEVAPQETMIKDFINILLTLRTRFPLYHVSLPFKDIYFQINTFLRRISDGLYANVVGKQMYLCTWSVLVLHSKNVISFQDWLAESLSRTVRAALLCVPQWQSSILGTKSTKWFFLSCLIIGSAPRAWYNLEQSN